jgi:hypothetical protein
MYSIKKLVGKCEDVLVSCGRDLMIKMWDAVSFEKLYVFVSI